MTLSESNYLDLAAGVEGDLLGAHPRVSEALLALAARVEAGEGADRELDGDIAELLNPYRYKPEYIRGQAGSYTTSVDAVTALLERVLPGWEWEVTTTGFKTGATVIPNGSKHGGAYASSPARALLAATLRALSFKTEEKK